MSSFLCCFRPSRDSIRAEDKKKPLLDSTPPTSIATQTDQIFNYVPVPTTLTSSGKKLDLIPVYHDLDQPSKNSKNSDMVLTDSPKSALEKSIDYNNNFVIVEGEMEEYYSEEEELPKEDSYIDFEQVDAEYFDHSEATYEGEYDETEYYDENEYFDGDMEALIDPNSSVLDSLDHKVIDLECRSTMETDVKRVRLIKELMKTESNYLANLETFKHYYLDPLKGNKRYMFISKIYGELDIIIRVNLLFFSKLSAVVRVPESDEEGVLEEFCRTKDNKLEEELATEIVKFSQALKLYGGYITKYKSFQEQITNEREKNKKFSQFLKDTQLKMAEDGKNSAPISSFMIAPIQRIPRYQILLSGLTKCSAHLKEVHIMLQRATDSIIKVAEFCNEREREVQNLSKVFMISKMLKIKSIVKPSRKYLAECKFKIERKSKKIGSAHFYLFNDLLIFVKKKFVKKPVLIPFDHYKIVLTESGGKAHMSHNNKPVTIILHDNNQVAERLFMQQLRSVAEIKFI